MALISSLMMFAAVGLWFTRPWLGAWPLLLVGAGLTVQLLAERRVQVTRFDSPLGLFLLSAGLAAWIAADQRAAWVKFWEITSAVVLFRAVLGLGCEYRLEPRFRLRPLHLFFGLLPAAIAVFFVLTTVWSDWMGKMAWLDPIRIWIAQWQGALSVSLRGLAADGAAHFHPNVAGGFIAMLLPLQSAAMFCGPLRWPWWLSIPLTLVSLTGLLLTASRGAWAAVAVVMVIWTVLCLSRRWLTNASQAARITVTAAVLIMGLIGGGLMLYLAGQVTSAGGGTTDRLALLGNSLALAMDYPFTGLGLGGYEMAYSSYVMLLHVGFLPHSHNLLIEIWLEQGLLGLLAVAWLAGAGINLRGPSSPWRWAAVASLAILLLHGLVDSPFYTGRGVHLLFAPLAVLALLPVSAGSAVRAPVFARRLGAKHWAWLAAGGMAVLLFLILPVCRSAWQANLGALSQTRAELSVYEWPKWLMQDALRRDPTVDLGQAIKHFESALLLNPSNVTANRRLGQIELSRGNYTEARSHLKTAYAHAPGQRATRQLLGESYAIASDTSRAAALWKTIDLSRKQLELREWWYEQIDDKPRFEAIKAARGLAGW